MRLSFSLYLFVGAGVIAGTVAGLFLSKGDLFQHEVGNWMRELWGDGQEGRLRLVTVLVSHKLDDNISSIRGCVPVGTKKGLSFPTQLYTRMCMCVLVFMCVGEICISLYLCLQVAFICLKKE